MSSPTCSTLLTDDHTSEYGVWRSEWAERTIAFGFAFWCPLRPWLWGGRYVFLSFLLVVAANLLGLVIFDFPGILCYY